MNELCQVQPILQKDTQQTQSVKVITREQFRELTGVESAQVESLICLNKKCTHLYNLKNSLFLVQQAHSMS